MPATLRLAAVGFLGFLAGCSSYFSAPEPPAFNPLTLQRGERDLAHELEPHPMRKLPTTLESPYLARQGVAAPRPTTAPTTGMSIRADNTVRIPLSELIQRSVIHSHDVRVAGYDPAI